ncbi:MAG: hypothetical protein JW749_01870 [Sedimentisphaerales bacterium]|nr:hypothetical protein [Sedimentisphaerales bacterium]
MPSIVNKPGKKGKRRAVGWLVEFAFTVVLMWLVFALAGRVMPRIALREISKLTNTKIDAETVDFRFDGSVLIRHLAVRPPISAEFDNSILKAKTMRMRFRLGSLLRFRPRVKEIFVDDFVLRAQFDSDKGLWNLSSLKIQMLKNGDAPLPLVWLENGDLEYSKVVKGRSRVIARTPVSVGLRPAEKIVGGYSFDVTTAGRQSFQKSAIFGTWQPGRIEMAGRISSRDLPGFERPWTVKSLEAKLAYEPNSSFELTAKVKNFNCPPSDLRGIFAFDTRTLGGKAPFIDALQNFFRRYGPDGTINLDFQASGNLLQMDKSKINGVATIVDVNVCDRDFAYAVEHIKGQIDLTDKSVKLRNMTGRHGDVVLALGGWATDEGQYWKYHLQITSENMLLDNDLYNALKTNEKKFWSAFSPSGIVAVNYSNSRLSQTDIKNALAVQLVDVNAVYVGFSYPLRNTNGLLFFSPDGVVFSNVISEWENRRITINGKVTLAADRQPEYDFLVNSVNIPLDSTLETALPAAQKEFYRQFEMTGIIDANIKIVSAEDQNGMGSFAADVFPRKSSIKARVLPIVISDVTGKIALNPDVVDIDALAGWYGDGSVDLSGRVWLRDGRTKLGYCLSMKADKIELTEELEKNLPGQLSALLSQLHLRGQVSVTADVSQNAVGDCAPNRLIIECIDNNIDCNFLPYPLRDISGRIAITDSGIEIDELSARAVHRIWGESIESSMKMSGKIELGQAGPDANETTITGGEMGFSGRNVRFKGKSLARVETIIDYEAQASAWLSRYFIADFYDGKMIGKVQLNKSGQRNLDYLLETAVAGADLKKFLSDKEGEKKPDEHFSTGLINGWLSVVGSISDDNIRLGRCQLKIIDMEVGKLSPLAKLLAVLNLTEPGDYAFDRMTVDAYIQDNRMFLRKLDLAGKSLAFNGSGWLDLRSEEINLTLTARGRRLSTASPSIWQSLTEGLGRAVMRVEVKGNIHDPQVFTKPLPVIKETLEILGTPKDN